MGTGSIGRFPKPDQRLRQDGSTLFAVVETITFDIADIVFFVPQSREHRSIGQGPVSVFVIEIVGSFLHEDADRLFRGFADFAWVGIASANVGEAADMA